MASHELPPEIPKTCVRPRAALAPRSYRVRTRLVAGLLVIGLTDLNGTQAAAQSARPEEAASAGPPASEKISGDTGPGKAAVKPWQWQLGVGVPLLAIGVIMTGLGGAFLSNPPVLDATGCNVMGLAGPCVLSRASSGTLLGFGVAFGIGGAVLTGFGIHSAVKSSAPRPIIETPIKIIAPTPGSIPAASFE